MICKTDAMQKQKRCEREANLSPRGARKKRNIRHQASVDPSVIISLQQFPETKEPLSSTARAPETRTRTHTFDGVMVKKSVRKKVSASKQAATEKKPAEEDENAAAEEVDEEAEHDEVRRDERRG